MVKSVHRSYTYGGADVDDTQHIRFNCPNENVTEKMMQSEELLRTI